MGAFIAGTHHAVLCDRHEGHDALLAQIAQEFVQMDEEVAFARHPVEVPVQAINNDQTRLLLLHGALDLRSKFAGRQVRDIHLRPAQTFLP